MHSKTKKPKKDLRAILCNIRSAHNVGSMFRTADGAGISKLYLCGYTPTPTGTKEPRNLRTKKQLLKAQRDIAKTALGAETFVPWETYKQTTRLIRKLKKEGVRVVALEQAPQSIPYTTFKPKFPLCLIVGNEVTGIPKSILNLADEIIEIPMRGKKESLNVAVAFGIAAYRIASFYF
jgi:tRNA G18 (ribose-2'-O)-methylase SpoU